MKTRHASPFLGGPRDGEPFDVDSPLGPPLALPGCCTKPDPQAKGTAVRCFGCGATGDGIDRYQLAARNPPTYRWYPPRPRRTPAAPPT